MTSRNRLLLGLLLAIPVALLVAWFLATHERVPRDVWTGFRGEARYNAFFALEQALTAHGARAESRATLGNVAELGKDDVVVLGTDVRTLGEQQVDALLAWMRRGGRLVFALPLGSDGRAGPLLDRLGIVPQSHYDCLAWTPLPGANPADADDDPDDDDGATAWCTGTRFAVDPDDVDEFAWLWGNEVHGWVLGRRARGKGGWTVAADFDFLDNDSLSESRNGALAWQVLAPLPVQGTVHLVYSADMPKYYVLLARMGWPILLPLVLALAAWLWSRVERMGPLLPLPPPARRALLDHVRAAGTFAWRRGRGGALHSALLRRVLGAATRRRPELLAMPVESVARALAEDAGVAPEAARHAIAPTALGQPQEFLSAIRTLTEIDARHDR